MMPIASARLAASNISRGRFRAGGAAADTEWTRDISRSYSTRSTRVNGPGRCRALHVEAPGAQVGLEPRVAVQALDGRGEVVERRGAIGERLVLPGERGVEVAETGINEDIAMRRHIHLAFERLQPLQDLPRLALLFDVGVGLAEQAEVERHAARQLHGPFELVDRLLMETELRLARRHHVQRHQEVLVDLERFLALAN